MHAQMGRAARAEVQAATRPAQRPHGQQLNAALRLEHAQRFVEQGVGIVHDFDGMLQHDAVDAVLAQGPLRYVRVQITVQYLRRGLHAQGALLRGQRHADTAHPQLPFVVSGRRGQGAPFGGQQARPPRQRDIVRRGRDRGHDPVRRLGRVIVIQASQRSEELRTMPIPASFPVAGLQVHRLPAFVDNYLWLLQSGTRVIAVDPGDAMVVATALERQDLTLAAILLTHHHPDHVGGVPALVARTPCPVFGPDEARIPGITTLVGDGHVIQVDGFPEIAVWAVPGHTRSHLAYLVPGAIFVGDTLFGAGCGRVFEGDARDLYRSLQRIARLPDDTWVFCAHEYTRANLAFAAEVEPGNQAVADRYATLVDGAATVPFPLAGERASNVFLRCDQANVRARVAEREQRALDDPAEVFVALRQWKNVYV